MRILHVVEASFAGVGRHVLDLADGQAVRGHEVHVAFSPLRQSEQFRDGRSRLSDVQFHSVPMRRSPSPTDLRSLVALRRLQRRIEPEVVHTHSTKAGLLGRALPSGGAFRLHTPHAPYSMNPMTSPQSRAVVRWLERWLGNRRSDAVLAVSPEEVDHLIEIGLDRASVHLVANGIDAPEIADRVAVRCSLGVPPDAFVIGTVGRLNDQKDPIRLVEAFDQLTGHDSAHLVLIGDGPLRSSLEQRVAESPAADRIHVAGERPGTWSMAAFDLFALPSRYEGFPYVLLEAAAHGLPIVTTEDAGASELVVDGVSGWIVPSMNTARLAEALDRALTSDHLEAMGAAAKEHGRPFTRSAMVDGVMAEIERGLNGD